MDFSDHAFAYVDFSGFVFPGKVDYSGTFFEGNSWFIGSRFRGPALFGNAIFKREASFLKSRFEDFAGFRSSTFEGRTSFGEATHEGSVDFTDVEFRNKSWFKTARFAGLVVFQGAIFGGWTVFGEAEFGQEVFFSITFSHDVNFEASVFRQGAHFRGAQFLGNASFDHAIFLGSTSFHNFAKIASFVECNFGGDASFEQANFGAIAKFHSAKFKGPARFQQATFSGDAAFPAVEFESYAIFDRARCQCNANFRGVIAKSAFTMADTTFSDVPNFEQATFVEAPHLDSLLIRSPQELQGPKVLGWSLETRWRALRRLATQGHDHERELLFFQQELLSRRWVADRPWHALFWLIAFYQVAAGFGRSLSRPVIAWTISWLGFAGLYAYLGDSAGTLDSTGLARPCTSIEAREPWLAALGLSLHRSLPALSGLASKLPEFHIALYGSRHGCLESVPMSVLLTGVFQTLISAVLIFLFLLTVRNHFRIR